MIEKFLSLVAFGAICLVIGWYYGSHPDVFVRHTGVVGQWIVNKVEGKAECPKSMVCLPINKYNASQVQ